MKKLIMMAATLIMCFAFSLSVMAAPSPEDEYDRESPEQTNVDKKTQIDGSGFSYLFEIGAFNSVFLLASYSFRRWR